MKLDDNWTPEVKVYNPRPTDCGVKDGYDLDVEVVTPQGTLYGEITLSPDHDDNWAPCGPCPDYWVSNGLVREMQETMSNDRFSGALNDLAEKGAAHLDRCTLD